MQQQIRKSDMQAILDLNMDLVHVNKDEEFNAIFDAMSKVIPFDKATLIHVSSAPQSSQSLSAFGLKVVSKNISRDKQKELAAPEYLLNNQDLYYAINQQEPFWLSHSGECDFGILGQNNLIASFSSPNSSNNTVLTLDCSHNEASEVFSKIVKYLLPSFHEAIRRSPHILDEQISPREYDVLQWIKEGKSTWEISKILSISERTVKFHIKNLCHKLNATNRTHALAKAIQFRLIDY
ncbi:response regulator transcription factor [Photobacterium lutimaris]|nr:helix-turn-helix transcriptional regulator [Photobacterium lutimaris]TDR74400.1 DNA-binding CsgD family transcriptional regulator [Photobacterium lutimaris]